MSRKNNRFKQGFTLLEVAFVMLVVGILAAALVPGLADLHHKSMMEEDRKILKTLKEYLIGQFIATGKLPTCYTSTAGTISSGNCNTANSLGGLGVRVTDSRNQPIQYDVADALTSSSLSLSSTSTATNSCSVLSSLAATSATLGSAPQICSVAPNYDDKTTWTTYCTKQNPVAFVLVANGLNRPGEYGETYGSNSYGPGNFNIGLLTSNPNRYFENPARRFGQVSPSQTWVYDDLMEVVTYQELLDAAGKFCTATGS